MSVEFGCETEILLVEPGILLAVIVAQVGKLFGGCLVPCKGRGGGCAASGGTHEVEGLLCGLHVVKERVEGVKADVLPSTMYFSFLSGVRRFSLIAVSTASVMRARVIAALSSCNFVIAATASSSVALGARPSFKRIFSMFFLMLLFGGCSVFSSCTVRFRSGRWSLSSPAARVSSFPS